VIHVSVREGFRIVFEDYIEPHHVNVALSSLVPANADDEWRMYLIECSITGYEPLNAFPAPPLTNLQYTVNLRRDIDGTIYLADTMNSVDVQHYMQCRQNEFGLRVSDAWSKSFEEGEMKTSVSIFIPTRPTIQACADWYRVLGLNIYGDIPAKSKQRTNRIGKLIITSQAA
jgi:hypothetical protein